jgi:HlyD family secretion protein
MDRPLDPVFLRQQRLKRIAYSLLGLALLIWIFVWLPGWIRPSLDRSRIRTAKVEWGVVEATITASGTVVPEFEQIIFSPIPTRLVAIIEKPGAVLRQGQRFVELDLSEARLKVEKLGEELALKENSRTQLELEMRQQLSDLQTRWRLKDLELQSAQTKTGQHRELQAMGAISKEQLRQSQLAEQRAAIELQQIEDNKDNIGESTQARIAALGLEMKILQREREEARHRLERADIRADRDGVLTAIVPQEGASIGQGGEIARIADLSSFRVDATVSDIHAQRLRTGLPVRLRLNENDYLEGRVGRILPTVDNGIINLEVELEEKAHPLLRPNMRVDVYIVTERKAKALRLKRGPFINGGEGIHDVFVIRGAVALKNEVRIGIANFDYYEVVEGLLEDDEVIISNMKDYKHMHEVRIK